MVTSPRERKARAKGLGDRGYLASPMGQEGHPTLGTESEQEPSTKTEGESGGMGEEVRESSRLEAEWKEANGWAHGLPKALHGAWTLVFLLVGTSGTHEKCLVDCGMSDFS